MIGDKLNQTEACCSRESTILEILEQERESLIQRLEVTNSAIRNLKHISPDFEAALKVVFNLGRR